MGIYGPNGVGKTNILEAISLLSPGRGLRRATVDEIARAPENLGWKVHSVLNTQGHLHEIKTSYSGEGMRVVLVDEKATTQMVLGQITRIVWLVPMMDRLWVEGAEGRRRFLDRLTLSLYPKHAEVSLQYEKAMRERNRMLKDEIRDPAWYDAIEVHMAETGAMVTENRSLTLDRLKTAQANAQTGFPTADLTMRTRDGNLVISNKSELCAAFAASRPRDMAAGRTLVGPHRDDLEAVYQAKGRLAKHCSTGEQKALLISLVLANGRAVAEDFGAPPVYLLDEVAAHLDADRRAMLYDEICALGAQAWMTGTGAELFDALGNRAQYLKVVEEGGVSHVTPIKG